MAVDVRPMKSNIDAAFLGLILGPVGLWYKRQWAAGFAWLAVCLVLAPSLGPLCLLLAVGMAIHAYKIPTAGHESNKPMRYGPSQLADPLDCDENHLRSLETFTAAKIRRRS